MFTTVSKILPLEVVMKRLLRSVRPNVRFVG